MFDFAIHSNKTITAGELIDATVFIKDNLIIDVIEGLPDNLQSKIIDVQDKVLMPGVIDPHVHINEPGRTGWEGFDTATKAAIVGGITTLVDMPLNASPVTTTAKALDEKLASTKNKLNTNVGFWGGIIPGNQDEIEPLIEKGVLGFKAFLTHSGIDEFPNVTEYDLRKAMPIIARHKLPLLVHCELTTDFRREIKPTYTDHTRTQINQLLSVTDNNTSYQNYLVSRPKEWEDNAIAMMIRLCDEFNCRTHIVHLSSANSIIQIAEAKQRGLPITVETAQHYLYFNAEEIPDGKTAFKCAPPIRERSNNEQLWQGLKNGIIDFVATDHSPAPPEIKQIESGDFMKAWGGISSLQFALPILWTAAKKRGYSMNDVVKWLCLNPAKLIAKDDKKGKIEKGYEADLIIFDDEKSFIVTEDIIQHRHKISPYINEKLLGVVERTYLQGKIVFDTGKFTQLNYGKIITTGK